MMNTGVIRTPVMKTILCLILGPMLCLLCCGGGQEQNISEEQVREGAGSVNALQLDYVIHIDDIPLTGPQNELVTLYISENMVRYDGVAEVNVADEIRSIKRTSLLDFTDDSHAFLNSEDSSYLLSFYSMEGIPSMPLPESDTVTTAGARIRLVKSRVEEPVNDLADVQKLNIIYVPDRVKGSVRKDSTPVISGEIWYSANHESAQIAANYYGEIAMYLNDDSFPGLELWRVLKKLEVPTLEIQAILKSLDGVMVRADLEVERYSLGKKAAIKIEVDLKNIQERRAARNKFEIPDAYRQALPE